MKRRALAEAVRVLEPGGQLFLAEFHRPDHALLRAFSWLYFKVFEPFGLALWDVQDPVRDLQALGGLKVERRTAFLGNFQLVVATRL
jgi:ubiquinone/menaquinone biosynthesis C-methylase UbiE